MYVCVCKAVTDNQIREEVCKGACSMRDLSSRLGVAVTCGKCRKHAKHVLHQSLNDDNSPQTQ